MFGLVCGLLGPWLGLLGSRICAAALLVRLAVVRTVCDSVTSLFIRSSSFELFLSLSCTLFVPFAPLWPGCASGAGLCRGPLNFGSASSLMFCLCFD